MNLCVNNDHFKYVSTRLFVNVLINTKSNVPYKKEIEFLKKLTYNFPYAAMLLVLTSLDSASTFIIDIDPPYRT